MSSQSIPKAFRRLAVATGIFALLLWSDHAALHGPAAAGERRLAAYGAEAVTIDRAVRDYRSLDQVEWKSVTGSLSQTAMIFGDPAKAGMYVQLLRRAPNDWSEPHTHPNDSYITVVSGTMLIGTGTKLDKKNTVALGPGSMIHDIAGQAHYDGTGPEGAVIEMMGMGPTARIPVKQ